MNREKEKQMGIRRTHKQGEEQAGRKGAGNAGSADRCSASRLTLTWVWIWKLKLSFHSGFKQLEMVLVLCFL